MTRLMPIGVFARATRLSIRALRNYDRLGLLSPARAAALDRIAERLGAVLEDPLLEVYERWREPQPTARLLLHTSLSGLARALGPAYARLLAGLARQGVAPVAALRTEVAWPVRLRQAADQPDRETE